MTEFPMNPLPPFDVLDFEVHAVFGAHFDIQDDRESETRWTNWFEQHKREQQAPVREAWTPIYRDHCSAITMDINTPEWCKTITVAHPELFQRGKPYNQPTPDPITMRVSRRLTVREDRVAAVTIRLKADKRNTTYDLADILAPLLLSPRIISGIKLDSDKNHNSEVKPADEMATSSSEVYRPTAAAKQNNSCALLDRLATDDKSPLFKLFLGTIKEVVLADPNPIWREYRPSGKPEPATKKAGREASQPPEILPWVGDQQVPYFVVFATVPDSVYDYAFLETGAEYTERTQANRQKYTRHIAAIILRWLSPHNANFISIEFLESLGLLNKGAFVNKYMNSLSFVTYSSTGALCLKPPSKNKSPSQADHSSEELGPQQATYGSILRCVELSRLRWHHALRLSRLLDDLTKRVIRHEGTERFDDFIAELLGIRSEAAHHFLDPLTYQWDATVGADIARFLQGDVIERVEDECIKKLNMVKQLLHEKLDVSRVRDIRSALEAPMRRKKS